MTSTRKFSVEGDNSHRHRHGHENWTTDWFGNPVLESTTIHKHRHQNGPPPGGGLYPVHHHGRLDLPKSGRWDRTERPNNSFNRK